MPMPKIYDSSFAYQLLSFFFSISPVYLLFQVLLNLLIFFLNNITFIVEIFEFSQFIDIVLSLYSNVPIHIFILYFHLSAPGFSVPDFQQTQRISIRILPPASIFAAKVQSPFHHPIQFCIFFSYHPVFTMNLRQFFPADRSNFL